MRVLVAFLLSCCCVFTTPLAVADAAQDRLDLLERLRQGYGLVPVDNARIQREKRRYQDRQQDAERLLLRADPFLHLAISEAERRQIPTELALLPVIESGFDPQATSRSQAAGLWQFIPTTGQLFGLTTTPWLDARRDPVQATAAAYDYLQQLYAMFNDWHLVLAAYNAGPGTVARAIQANVARGLPTDYWSLTLPQEAMEYVPRFLAVADWFRDPAAHGLRLPRLINQPRFETVLLQAPLSLEAVARQLALPLEQLRVLNAQLTRGQHGPQGPWLLHVPTGTAVPWPVIDPLLVRAGTTPALPVARRQTPPGSHVVREGETLSSVARAYLTTLDDLQRLNPWLRLSARVVGQRLVVPELPESIPPQSSEPQL